MHLPRAISIIADTKPSYCCQDLVINNKVYFSDTGAAIVVMKLETVGSGAVTKLNHILMKHIFSGHIFQLVF